MKYIVVDLDGTLYDSSNRVHLAHQKQWDEFHNASVADKPFYDVKKLLDIVGDAGVWVIACTGRNERYRGITEKWLNKYSIPVDVLLMRPDNNFESDADVKLGLVRGFLCDDPDGFSNILFVLEDRDKMVDAWRAIGVPCYQVRPSGY